MHLILALAAAFALASMIYVFRFRGDTRYTRLREYMRKAWPVFAPLNCVLFACTQKRGRRVFMDLDDFGELLPLQSQWQEIRAEVMHLHRGGYFERSTDPATAASFDIGFRTFFKYGWSRFYLNWYGYTHASAQALCPNTVRILSGIPSVNGAMFSLLPAGSQLTRHTDPLAVSLRYHLGLATPNSSECFIDVDGQRHSWRDGEAALFDITYLHYARNDSTEPRLILMCDVERPLNFVGKAFNVLYKGLARLTVVPNLEGDRRGIANRVFASVAPAFARTKALKRSNRPLYTLVKYAFNGTLIATAGLLVFGLLRVLGLALG